MAVLLHKYYIKKPDEIWIARARKTDVEKEYSSDVIQNLLTPWLERLRSLPNFIDFDEEYIDENTFRFTFKFDVPDDKAIDTYKNFIKVMRNTKDSVIKDWDDFVETQHIEKNIKFPGRFYQTVDSTGNTIEYQIASL